MLRETQDAPPQLLEGAVVVHELGPVDQRLTRNGELLSHVGGRHASGNQPLRLREQVDFLNGISASALGHVSSVSHFDGRYNPALMS